MSETTKTRRKPRPGPGKGAQEATERSPQPCQDCGHIPEAGAAFCSMCGAPLDEPAEAVAEAPLLTTTAKSPAPAKQTEPVDQEEPAQVEMEQAEEASDEAVAAEEPADGLATTPQGDEGQPGDATFCTMCGSRIGQAVPKYRLTCSGPAGETSIEVPEGGMAIGKSGDCDLVLSGDEYVSRRHARLFLSDGQLLIKDLNSSNGTFLSVRKPVAVEAGDEVLIGRNILRIETVQE